MVFSRLVSSVESFFGIPGSREETQNRGKTRQAITSQPDRGEPETETDAPPPYDGPNSGEGTSSRTLTAEEELYYAQLRQHDAAMQQYMAGMRGNAPFVLMPPVPPVPPPSMQAGPPPTTRITMDWAPLPMTGWPPHLAMHRAPPPTIHVHRAPPPTNPHSQTNQTGGPPNPSQGGMVLDGVTFFSGLTSISVGSMNVTHVTGDYHDTRGRVVRNRDQR